MLMLMHRHSSMVFHCTMGQSINKSIKWWHILWKQLESVWEISTSNHPLTWRVMKTTSTGVPGYLLLFLQILFSWTLSLLKYVEATREFRTSLRLSPRKRRHLYVLKQTNWFPIDSKINLLIPNLLLLETSKIDPNIQSISKSY